ncbi:MAG: hypothetical protein HYU59_08780 [Magnetospirillum gryphiswaldense]|nr:hypothetical protein [Magnetospirillum gryphiswaldense]
MTLPPAARRLVQLASWLVMCAALVYLVDVLIGALPRMAGQLRLQMALPMVLSVPVYVVLLMVVAAGWATLVVSGVPQGRTARVLVAVYGTSQLAKYLPGNVFHLVGRQVLGQGHGFSQRAMVYASLQEAASVLIVCVGLSLAVVPLSKDMVVVIILAGVVSLLLALFFHRRLGVVVHVPAFLAAMVCHGVFLTGTAVIVYLLAVVLGVAPLPFGTILASWCWAYLSGFATPAAPGGIGVREAAFVALVPQQDEVGLVLVLVFAMRVISASGDLLFAAIAHRVGRP